MRRTLSLFLTLVFLLGYGLPVLAQSSEYGKESFGEFDQALGKLRRERDKLLREVETLKEERENLSEQLRLRIEEAESRADRLQGDLDDARLRMEMLDAEKADILDRLKDAELKLSRYDDVMSSRDSVLMEAKEENRSLKKSLADVETVLQRSSEMIQKLKREKEGLASELEIVKTRLKEYYFGQESELADIKRERGNLLERINTVSAKLKTEEARGQESLSENRELRKKLRLETEKSLERESVLKKEKDLALSARDNALNEAKKAREESVKAAKEHQRAVADLENKNRVQERMLGLANEKLQSYEERLASAKSAPAALPAETSNLREETLTGEILGLRRELAERDKRIDSLKAELNRVAESYQNCLRSRGEKN
ncbi:MAG: hypothetical protein WC732_05920 [Candidatus Omnitrophota bacterium]